MSFSYIKKYTSLLLLILFFIPFVYSYALESESDNFTIKDSSFGNLKYMSSDNFSLQGSLNQFSIGSSVASTFNLNSGFLYFPKVTSPVLSASAGNAQASLSWTASEGFLGTTIGGYLLGQATSSSGPYTFTALGNVTNAIKSSLTNGQTYYFIIQAQDVFGEVVAQSGEVSVTPVTTSNPPSGGGGGGGGGGRDTSTPSDNTQITIKGLAYPHAKLVILKDAQIGKEVTADANGDFEVTFDVAVGIYSFGIYALDKNGFKSPTFGFTVNSRENQTVTTSDVVVAPTINANKTVVKFGNNIELFGYAYPVSIINVQVNSENKILDQTVTDKYGRWIYRFNSAQLEKGDHTALSQTVAEANLASTYSSPYAFQVGDVDVYTNFNTTDGTCSIKGDINNDTRINIVDFSILMYFWSAYTVSNPCVDINKDSKVDIRDFSIMLYWWTG